MDSIPVSTSMDFMPEIWQNSGNPPDFIKSGGFHDLKTSKSVNSRETLHFQSMQGEGYVI